MARTIHVFINDYTHGELEYDLTNYTTLPIATNEDLSKVLDTTIFELPLTPATILPIGGTPAVTLDLSEPIRPLSKIEITDGVKVFKHYVREDRVLTFYDVGDGELYKHSLSTIEQTKLLELRPIPNMTVTQPRGQVNYALSALTADDTSITQNTTTTLAWTETTPSSQPTIIDGLTLKQNTREYTISVGLDMTLILDDYREVTLTYKLYVAGAEVESKVVVVETDSPDTINFLSTISTTYTTTAINQAVTMSIQVTQNTWNVQVNSINMQIKSTLQEGDNVIISIEDVLDKVLIAYKTYDMNDTSYTQEITLDDETRNAIKGISSPEFTFSGYTVHKVFEEIGDLIKAITRMKDKEVIYDFINKYNRKSWTNPHETQEVKQLTLDQYASSLEVNAENVIESIERQNVVVEPYKNGWFTLRADKNGPEKLTDTTLSIKTRFKQYEIKKILAKGFLVTYTDASTSPITTEWDITDYIAEQTRWNVLFDLSYDSSSERTTVNQGKGNTLYFTSGEFRVKNFGYRSPKATSVSALREQVIYQIIASVATQITSKIVSTVQPNGGAQNLDNLLQTQYRVDHVALTTIRARVHKHNAREFPVEATLFVNESAKINDTDKLGAYAQTLANRTGNQVRIINGVVESRNDLPEIGNIVGDREIVTSVNVEIENGLYAFEATLFYDYTEISSFVGVDSAYRQFQVPLEGIVERDLIYTEPITITTAFTVGEQSHSIFTTTGREALAAPFAKVTPVGITYHTFQTRFDEKTPSDSDWDTAFDKESEGPVDVKHVGMTSVIKVRTKDNWSVDDNVEDGYDRYDSGISTLHTYQNDFLYKSPLGRYDSARYVFYGDGKVDNSIADGELYPEISQVTVETVLADIDIKTLADARESMALSINVPFFARLQDGVEDLRVYNGVAKYNGITLQDSNADIVAVVWDGDFPSVENIVIDATQFLECTSYGVAFVTGTSASKLTYSLVIDNVSDKTYNGWGLINKNNNELIYLIKDTIVVVGGVTKNYSDDIWWYTDKTKGL